jgi:hypothetical protein
MPELQGVTISEGRALVPQDRGVEVLLPLCTAFRRWNDRGRISPVFLDIG